MRALLPFALVTLAAFACDSVTVDDSRSDNRLIPPRGIVRGTITYAGKRPCSKNGHIVGAAIVLVFDRKNPPPPAGLATTALNFVAVPGDVLFASEPRTQGPDLYCPAAHGFGESISAAAPFVIAPLDAGSYVLQGFYDTAGEFLPTFKFRNGPVAGDVVGGYLDTADAVKHAGDPSYQPIFLPVDVGVPMPGAPAGSTLTMPASGFLADNVPVTLGAELALTRPYFHPEGAETFDGSLFPIVTMPQDQKVLAQPSHLTQAFVDAFQGSFPALHLSAGFAPAETPAASQAPFDAKSPGLFVWKSGASIPETAGQAVEVPLLSPSVVLMKLDDADTSGLTPQGSDQKPIVIIQAITLSDDSILSSALFPPASAPAAENRVDHLTALVRPSVVCFDPRKVDQGGLLVTPHFTGASPDPSDPPDKPLFDPTALQKAQGKLVREVRRGCLPKGKYAMNLVYPTGQTWTVPNEMGSCAALEGPFDPAVNPSSCRNKPRPVLASQGIRAVLEVVDATDPATCSAAPVPPECVQNP